ncbi:MAG: DUF6446 family protein [Rhodobacteraceae bacterium]|nr:DUF6446 family protein [Paracoccaceae bacterium]
MTGRLAVLLLLAVVSLTGAALWYLGTYVQYTAFHGPQPGFGPVLELQGIRKSVSLADIQGIQGDSSPLKFRACFRTDPPVPIPADAAYPDPTPLVAPDWFGCFDAERIGADLEADLAQAVLVKGEIASSIDRVVAFYPDGRGYVWHQLSGYEH